ncbi:restriction endonuclease subunit S [Ulvibacter litoralis]|uniref:Type I restriction enzyme, S subunit n=1 Tax=Ulvibacter litoralis TaxID=227084 RepID=A0A1G7CAJ3_9FLAO|nr:restriction endonuclease subunit S [Ulvibacter litoralis]GHC48063.1 hypothetical protein GCM10008083_09200 [Ulvibacter litoralis]SDE36233.1 type I restriction enzyme, S subunit [Ulvibacter litoralis]
MREGWKYCSLEQHIKLIDYRGRTPKKTESGVKLITAKNVKLGYLQNYPEEFIAEDNYEEWMRRGIPNYGDVIFTTEAPLANVAQLLIHEKVAFAQRTIVMQPESGILDQTFLKYLLLSPEVRDDIFSNGTGATVTGIKSSLLKKIQIPIPPFQEQKQIVAILDKAFTAIDQAKANIEKNIENAKELFQSKLNDIFSQKGEGWEEKTLGEVCEKTKNIKWQDFASEEFEYVDLSSVSRETLSVTETTTVNKENAPSRAKKIIHEGDVIFATTRPTLRRATIIDEEISGNLCSTGYVVLRPTENISSDWIFFYLLTTKFMDRMKSLQRGASYPAVSDNDVKGSKLSIPRSKVEEKQNILIMKNLQEKTNSLIKNYEQKLEDLEDLKKSMLKKAFAGELTEKEVAV